MGKAFALLTIVGCALCCVVEFCFICSPEPLSSSLGFIRPYNDLFVVVSLLSPLISPGAYLLVVRQVRPWYRWVLGLLVCLPFFFGLFFFWWASGWD